jgi:hypothetical protein
VKWQMADGKGQTDHRDASPHATRETALAAKM